AGNSVIAKPAEQTPRIALRAISLLHGAGIPADALICAIGDGETIGAPLVADPGIAGIAFTGSIETAKRINAALAAREGPIIRLSPKPVASTPCWLTLRHCPSRSWTTWSYLLFRAPASAVQRSGSCSSTKVAHRACCG